MNGISIREQDGQLFVFTPYNQNFITAAKKAGGKWNANSKCWVFSISEIDAVHNILKDVYGYTPEAAAAAAAAAEVEEHQRLNAVIADLVKNLPLEMKKTLVRNLKRVHNNTYAPSDDPDW